MSRQAALSPPTHRLIALGDTPRPTPPPARSFSVATAPPLSTTVLSPLPPNHHAHPGAEPALVAVAGQRAVSPQSPRATRGAHFCLQPSRRHTSRHTSRHVRRGDHVRRGAPRKTVHGCVHPPPPAVLDEWGRTTMAVSGIVDPAFFVEPSWWAIRWWFSPQYISQRFRAAVGEIPLHRGTVTAITSRVWIRCV